MLRHFLNLCHLYSIVCLLDLKNGIYKPNVLPRAPLVLSSIIQTGHKTNQDITKVVYNTNKENSTNNNVSNSILFHTSISLKKKKKIKKIKKIKFSMSKINILT